MFELNFTYRTPPGPAAETDLGPMRVGMPVSGWPGTGGSGAFPDNVHRNEYYSFDPNYESYPLEKFEPMVRNIFARKQNLEKFF